jgi:hypothetical protein
MTEESSPGPRTNSSHVTIAFPFSAIKIAEPDDRVTELASIVLTLAERVAKLDPGSETNELVERARASLTALA